MWGTLRFGGGVVLHVGQLVAAGETLCGHQMQVTYRHCKCKLILTIRYMKWRQEFGLIYRQWDKSNTVVSMFGTSTFRDKIRRPHGQPVGSTHSRAITQTTLSSVTLRLPISEDDCFHIYGMTFLQWFNVSDDSTRCMHFSDNILSCSSYFLRLCRSHVVDLRHVKYP
jgi:hypothetical protein